MPAKISQLFVTGLRRYSTFQVCLLWAGFAFVPFSAAGDEPPPDQLESHAVEAAIDHGSSAEASQGGVVQWLVDRRYGWSSSFTGMVRAVDYFFAGEDYEEEHNGSHLKLSLGQIFQKGGQRILDDQLKVNLDLPGTEQRWQLVLTTDDDEEPAEGQVIVPEDDVLIADSEKDLTGALRFVMTEYDNWRFSADLGARAPFPLDPFARVSAKRTVRLDEHWRLRVRQQLYQYWEEGFVSRSSVRFSRPITASYLLREEIRANYHEDIKGWRFSNGLSTIHVLNDRYVVNYSIGVSAETQPYLRMDQYFISTRLRKLLYEDWFYVDLQPALAFPRADAYEPSPSFTLRFELVFAE